MKFFLVTLVVMVITYFCVGWLVDWIANLSHAVP
jgi:hypothetical protein